jgi:hypothetical protein
MDLSVDSKLEIMPWTNELKAVPGLAGRGGARPGRAWLGEAGILYAIDTTQFEAGHGEAGQGEA